MCAVRESVGVGIGDTKAASSQVQTYPVSGASTYDAV